MLPDHFRDNRISQDVKNFYHYDEHGRLTEKDERRIHPHGSLSHHYEYDNQHRLVHYRRMQAGNVLTESRYLYDPPGRRVSKRVWACTVFHDGSCSQPALQETVWYAWDGNRLTTTQTDKTRIQTVYLPGSFTPLIRIETATGELTRATRRTLAEKFQQEANVTFPPELVARVDNLEAELRRGELSEASRTWLAQCGLTPEQMKNQLEPIYIPVRKIHLYHCDHRGLPLALIDVNGAIAWRAEFDEWGNILREDNPYNLEQLIRLPGQQWDKETGLYYNRHRYYDPAQGRYITQDPIGLAGGWNLYQYPLNPVTKIDPLGLFQMCHRDLLLPIPYARHCYVKFDDGSTSSYDPKGVNPDPDPHQEGTVCTEPKQPALDDCIKKAMDQCKGKDYSFTEFNCCHCAEQAMKECGTSIPKGAWPNSPVNPGPQPGENGFTPDPVYNSTLGK